MECIYQKYEERERGGVHHSVVMHEDKAIR